MKDSSPSRRNFIKKLTGSTFLLAAGISAEGKPQFEQLPLRAKPLPANDKIRLGVIGAGIMGYNNLDTALQTGSFELAGVCDLYSGHLQRAKEDYDAGVFTTKSYEELLARKDIDAVVVATTDHWHDKISIAAMKAGKAVYCEKPMVHKWEEGRAVIDEQNRSGAKFQVGSQRVSSIVTEKAADLYASGELGQLIMGEVWYDRQSALGAWQYSIPRDASLETIDWDRYLGDAPKTAFDPVRFFRWRNYRDYGTGVAGDLFVHLFSGLHRVIKSAGPNRIYATGGLRYWKDGRDVPDVMLAVLDYPATDSHPAFNLQMRVNFVDGSGGSQKIRLIGSEGVMEIGGDGVKITRSIMPEAPGFGGWDTYNTFTKAQQAEYEAWYQQTYPEKRASMNEPKSLEFLAPRGYSDHLDHWNNFADAIRNGTPIIEDALFGMQAAGPALLTNLSYFDRKEILWDPMNVKVI
ncbi:MAG: Gfo/Idh/MocA family oxidoreductase [Bacteroidia bacterium]|nr:Gfo/Idh/MocA family oxidoreductase [Bacteroidia bacterium]